MSKVIGTLMIRDADGEGALARRGASKVEIQRMVAAGYRPIGPVGWDTLRKGGFLPSGESYLGKTRKREEDEL